MRTSYHLCMDGDDDNSAEANEIASLDMERARKFLMQLADDPFVAVVVTDDGEVKIFSKGIEPDHLARIKTVLESL